MSPDRSHAMDHVVLVLFENRSLDNLLGHLYGLEDGKRFEGVIGKDLSNPIPEWAEHGTDRKVVPYTVAADMDSPNPDDVPAVQNDRFMNVCDGTSQNQWSNTPKARANPFNTGTCSGV